MTARSLRWCFVVLGTLATACSNSPEDDGTSSRTPSPEASEVPAAGVRVRAVTGPGGLRSDGLPEGAFLGPGATVDAGRRVETPKGTLAELELPGGTALRLQEGTAVRIPATAGDKPVLERGEVVVLVGREATEPVEIATGDETVRIDRGEVQVRRDEHQRHVAVVYGHAVLDTGTRAVDLQAGESIDAPLPDASEPTPSLSLRPLEETAWARTFDRAATMAVEVPRGVGSLTARVPGSHAESQRLRLVDQRVDVTISGRVAHTEVEQAFANDRSVTLEGIYRFPLPGDSTISGLGLLVGNTWMRGEVVEKQRARAIFQQIVDATVPRDPALLEWERGNVFKLRVFPIPGRGERRVRLSWTQVLPAVGDTLRYRYPMGGTGATGTPIDHFVFTVHVDKRGLGGAGVDDIATPMLTLDRRDLGETLELHTEREGFLPAFDLGVDLPAPPAPDGVTTSIHRDQDGQTYFMVSARPDLDIVAERRPVHYAFVLDRSHSTSPELWTLGRGIVEALADGMDPQDRFTVLACDTACDEVPGGLQAVQSVDIGVVQRFLESQDLAGASDIGGMLEQGAEALVRGGTGADRVIVYLGDGTPSAGPLAADEIAASVRGRLDGARVMAVALGSRSDLLTLEAIVDATAGDLMRADARDDLAALVTELRLRAEVPTATELSIDLSAGMSAVHRANVSALRPGDDLVLVGKLEHAVSGAISVRARGPRGPVEATIPVALDPRAAVEADPVHRHLPRTWARLQIAHLSRTKGFSARDEIVALSRRYGVGSRFTSFLVLENDAMYREFGVARNADQTDTWDGGLGTGRTGGGPIAGGEAGAVTGTSEGARTQAPGEAGRTGDPQREPVTDPVSASRPSRKSADPATTIPAGPPSPEPDFDDLFDPPVPAAPRGQARDEEESRVDLDDDRDVERREDAGRSTPPPPARAKRPSTSSAASQTGGASAKPSDGPVSPGWGSGRGLVARAPARLVIREAPRPSERSIARVNALRAAVDAAPTSRAAHRDLVRAAILAADPRAPTFARAWAESDPDHAPALLALADALAREADPISLRAYASAAEVSPFSLDQHERLARAFASKGDLRRACSHRRAMVSIDPARGDHHAELALCLARAGRPGVAEEALRRGESRAVKNPKAVSRARQSIEAGARPTVRLPARPELHAELVWTANADLDVALVDRRGRVLSAMHPRGIEVSESPTSERLTARRIDGSVFVEITRNDAEPGKGPVRAELTLRTSTGARRTFPVVVENGSTRVARIAWSR